MQHNKCIHKSGQNKWRQKATSETCAMNYVKIKKKRKLIPVTGRGGPQGCETSRLPHFLDNRLTDGSEVISLTRGPHFTPQNIPDTHFC
jgi:hypothetical protein